MDFVMLWTASGLWIAFGGTIFQFRAAIRDLATATESAKQNRAAVALTPPLRPWSVRQHLSEWKRVNRQFPPEVRRAILSYRRTVLGWLLLLLGSFIAAVATTVGI